MRFIRGQWTKGLLGNVMGFLSKNTSVHNTLF